MARGRKVNGTNAADLATDAGEYPGLEHWRGTVDEKLRGIAGSFGELKAEVKENAAEVKRLIEGLGNRIEGSLRESDKCGKKEHEEFDKRISDLETARNRFGAKVGMLAGFAGIIGGGISSAGFSTIFHKIFG